VSEEIAFHHGWISAEDVARMAEPLRKNNYGRYSCRSCKSGSAINP